MSDTPQKSSYDLKESRDSFSRPVNGSVVEGDNTHLATTDEDTVERALHTVRHARPEHANTVLVDWSIGNRCNHACSYCPAILHDGSIGWQDAYAIRRMFRKLHDHYHRSLGKRVWLQFTGGEPTMHPKFRELVHEAAAIGHKVSLISNASRTLRFWETLRDHLDAAILTYHSEFVDHAHFLKVARCLADAMPTHVNVTLPPDRFDEVYACAEEIAETLPDVSLSLKPLRVDFGSRLYDYTPEQLGRLDTRLTIIDRDSDTVPRSIMVREFSDGHYDMRRANAMIVAEQNRWKGMICSAGIESLRIDNWGNITRAVCGAGGRLGHIDGPFDLPTSPVRCGFEECACVADILITKRALAMPAHDA